MDDIDAFDRQIASEVLRATRPPRAVDDFAILNVILAATHSPRWRFPTMFSATQVAIAGSVVALFGGFLLTGALTQPRLERAPAAATSELGTFSPTGSPAEAHWFGTATLLPDGRVLVVGGLGEGPDPFSSAEIWDPRTGSFSPTGSPAEGRAFHTATLLPDGRVLVVGGEDRHMLRSAEVWDPETGEFTAAGSLARAHAQHTATLLSDGRVLIVGGYSRTQHYARTAEVWDPETASFHRADLLAAVRHAPSATLLSDGRVLIVGGEGENAEGLAMVAEPAAEVWDPVSGSSTPAGSLAQGRKAHTATLLGDGRVLIVGGAWLTGSGDYDASHRPTTVAEVWDPETGSFGPAGSPLVEGRVGHTATLVPDGRVLIVGGIDEDDDTTAAAEIWDPTTASFARAGSPLLATRKFHTATLLPDGRVLIVGGQDGTGTNDGAAASAEIWQPGD